jgi:mRNA interferase MazF
MVKRFDVYLLNLDTEVGESAKNTRPCVVISPDEINDVLPWAIVAPLSSGEQDYPTRIVIDFLNNRRSIVLDQIRAVDGSRLVKKIGEIDAEAQKAVTSRLVEMFS